MTNESLNLFFNLHERLENCTPINEARHLESEVVDPKTADAKTIWKVLWDKPLFAGVSVGTAVGWVDDIKDEMEDSWKTWGEDPEMFQIHHEGPGIQRDRFHIRGEAARSFADCHAIPRHRLYAIQGAAIALRSRLKRSSFPFDDLPDRPLSEVVPELRKKFKFGWGKITVLHALTDMGLAVKPDRQLRKTMEELGLESKDPIRINEAARNLLDEINACNHFDPPVSLRYLDKVLMEISRLGLLQRKN